MPNLEVTAIGRDGEYNACLIVYFNRKPTDDEMREFHEWSKNFSPRSKPKSEDIWHGC